MAIAVYVPNGNSIREAPARKVTDSWLKGAVSIAQQYTDLARACGTATTAVTGTGVHDNQIRLAVSIQIRDRDG
jgi:hypothetical protein